MPYRRKDSPYWWVKYTDASGKGTYRSTGTTSRREAQALEAKWRLEAHQMRHWGVQPEHTFDELMVAYLKATSDTMRSRFAPPSHRDRHARWSRPCWQPTDECCCSIRPIG